ncbi:MAG: restriction endonuclease subunit S [Syntrophaceae bacterium]
MATNRKEGALTIEEKLKAALVPEDEQPYAIPENWVWTRVGKVTEINMGQSPAGIYTNTDSNGIPLVGGPADMGDVYPTTERFTSQPTKTCKKGDIIVSVRATIGKLNVADKVYCLGRGVAGIRGIEIKQHFIKRYFQTCTQSLVERGTGTTFLQVSREDINALPFPIVPLPEQQRIAEMLESLLGKIKEARLLLDEVPEILQNFRQSVLAVATSGKLTEDWRGEKGYKTRHSWRTVGFEELLASPDKLSYGVLKPGTDDVSGTEMYRVVDIGEWGKKNPTRPSMISKKLAQEYVRTMLESGDVLLSVMATIGRAMIVTEDMVGANVNRAIVVIKPNREIVDSHFLLYHLLSPAVQTEFEERQIGSAQPRINLTELRKFQVPLPPLNEQAEIVRRVKSLFGKADGFEAEYKEAMELIEALPEIILSKAFRGDLVPQDPLDEPAIALLKRIIEQREDRKPVEMRVKEVVMIRDDVVIKERIPLINAIKEAKDWISAPDLLLKAGYPLDADPDTIEDFYLQLKQELNATPPRIERKRRGDNDYFKAL